jgi:hypothetical protein
MKIIEPFNRLNKSGIRANLSYYQTRMDRLKQEIRELEFQYQLNICAYSLMIDSKEDNDDATTK